MNIEKLELLSDDIAGTIRFYKDILDMQVLSACDDEVTFAAGRTKLCFRNSEKLQHPVYHFAFTIPANKLDEAFRFVSSRVAVMDVPPSGKIADFSNWDAAAFYFYDNNGNIVEYIARYSIRNQIGESFDGSKVYAISEIGLVTENVPALLEDIAARFDVPVFAKQPPQQRFAVMGDDEGLFIVVENERPWYPTQVKALSFPTGIGFRNNKGELLSMSYPLK
jgi:hypothetical protein